MKLIADCGSTKIDWRLLDGDCIAGQFSSPGMNAVMLDCDEITARLASEVVPQIEPSADVTAVYFYGAGCLPGAISDNVSKALTANFTSAGDIEVHTDLLAAARALSGRSEGIACILGTGSNSCRYDGEKICENVSPLGYILGDEGSGAVLGRILVGDVLKRQLPQHLCDEFLQHYGLDRLTIIQRVYREPQANRFLASFAPFLAAHIDEPAIRSLVSSSFASFMRRNVMQYAAARVLPVGFVGSVAWHFKELLAEAVADAGCTLGRVIKSPMDGLLRYHSM